MPAYNTGAYIKDAIQSALSQTYKNIQLVVVDDGSTDSTADIVKGLQRTDDRIIYHYQPNKGLGAARNSAFKIANGDWIALLDADDTWHPKKLQIQMQIAKQTNTDFIFSQGHYLNQSSGTLTPYDSLVGECDSLAMYQKLIIHNFIPALSALFKRNILDAVGLQGTDEIIKGNEDWDYWLRICATRKYNFIGIPDRLFQYRIHSTNMSANKAGMRIAALYVQVKNYMPNLMDVSTKNVLKRNFVSSLPFVFKNLSSDHKDSFLNSGITLLFKLLFVSYSKLPAFIYQKLSGRGVK